MELAETQKQLQELENKELRDVPEKAKLQKEFRKKMDAAKLKVQVFPIWPLGISKFLSQHRLWNLYTVLVKLSPASHNWS